MSRTSLFTLIFVLYFLAACGQGAEKAGEDDGSGNQWDKLEWDKGKWG